MRTEFQSPADYLSYLQTIYSVPYTDGTVVDQEFRRLTEEALQRINVEAPSGHVDGLQMAIDEAYRDTVAALDVAERGIVESQIAAGVLETGRVEAFVARSPDGKFEAVWRDAPATERTHSSPAPRAGRACRHHIAQRLPSGARLPTEQGACSAAMRVGAV